ncbi:MAG: FHA domain-containing protein [archaeon]|nr:FHA domain-containing protein [archaeon]
MKENCNIKSIHVITLNNTDEPTTIGRGHESDVRINDISVSRSHALLKYDRESGRLLLRDLRSKFGTLVLLKRPLTIKEKKIHLQIGRTYIEAILMPMKEFERLKKEKKNKTQHQAKNNQAPQGGLFGGQYPQGATTNMNDMGDNNLNANGGEAPNSVDPSKMDIDREEQ